MTEYHLGVDSTDSATLGMCTTYLGARLAEEFVRRGFELAAPPELVRLNPNVPWKTRGNGAVHLRLRGEAGRESEIFATAEKMTESFAELEDPQTNPGLVLITGGVCERLNQLYRAALHRIVDLAEALAIGEEAGARMRGWKNRRGLIGALSAVGACFSEFTWEVIAYRWPERYGRDRSVSAESVVEADRRHPSVFFNVDPSGKLLCVPRSPCPVLFGIRGTDPADTLAAASEIESEPIERWVLWRTNQHTDAHIEKIESVAEAVPYRSINLEGVVASPPEYKRGGHLYFELEDAKGDRILCAAYRQTKSFREKLSGLAVGDRISVWGAVRPPEGDHPTVVNLEKIRIDECVPVHTYVNPHCPRCGGRMESLGKGKGLRCKKCRLRAGDMAKERVAERRSLDPGFLEPHPEAWRHLYRPCSLPKSAASSPEGPFWGLGRPVGRRNGRT